MHGDLLHQRCFIVDHLTKKQVPNRGELPMVRVLGAHEGSVSQEVFEKAQNRLNKHGKFDNDAAAVGLVFSKKIVCGACGKNFRRGTNGQGANRHRTWLCGGRDKRFGDCKMRPIPEPTLLEVTAEVLGLPDFDGEIFAEKVEIILAQDDRKLTFVFADGTEKTVVWQRRGAK